MAYFRRSSKRSKPDGRCKKHPKHHQSPGVCSLCLREKLTQLSTTTSRRTSAATAVSSSPSSLSSYSSSSSVSSCSSPAVNEDYYYHREGKGSVSFLFGRRNNNGLSKSRSMVLVQRISKDRDGISKKKNKVDGFWSKLLHPTRGRNQESLSYSRTVKRDDGSLINFFLFWAS